MKYRILLFLVSILWFASCDQLKQEYEVSAKQSVVKEADCFVEGFLQVGVPIEDDDMLVIPVANGLGKTYEFRFQDNSAVTGISVEDAEYTLEPTAKTQYLRFKLSGKPLNEGVVPISYEVFEHGVSQFYILKASVSVWSAGAQRPARGQIPTLEKPFVFLRADITWPNQSTLFWYANPESDISEVLPAASKYAFVKEGVNYTMLVNIRYNSILNLEKALTVDYTNYEVPNTNGVLKSQDVPTQLLPTAENLAAHPEWFTRRDGQVSAVWHEGDRLKFGVGVKPVLIGYYDSAAALVVSGTQNAFPHSSLSWNVNDTGANNPLGTLVTQPGDYLVWAKFVNNDVTVDIAQYLPGHPGTGEAGWVPIEFTVTEKVVPQEPDPDENTSANPAAFELDATLDNPDWRPDTSPFVRVIRGEFLSRDAGNNTIREYYRFTPDVQLTAARTFRIWFVSKRGETISGPNFKLKQVSGSYDAGFENADVVAKFGTGSVLKGGTSNNRYDYNTAVFADGSLETEYSLSYVDLNLANGCVLKSGTTDTPMTFHVDGSAGNNPPLPYNLQGPIMVRFAE